jgi:metal-responsive CopG/Arc/MetJ family transcriptional regulator
MVYNVMAVVVSSRSKNSADIQKVFTKHGCIIKVRLGLHEAGNVCSEDGLILLQLTGERDEIEAFRKELCAIEGVRAQSMEV